MNELTIPAYPNLPVNETAYVWLEDGELAMRTSSTSRIKRGLTVITYISRTWQETRTGLRVLVPNTSVRAALKNDWRLFSIISALEALPASGYLVDVGEALCRKFPDKPLYSVNRWLKALGIKSRDYGEVLQQMAEAAGEGTWSLPQLDLVKKMMTEERYLLSTRDPFKQFSSVSYLADVWDAMVRSDPVGREYYRSDGTIFDVTVTGTVGGVVAASCEQAIKLKAGKKVVVLDEGSGYPGSNNQTLRIISVKVDHKGVYQLKLSPERAGRLLSPGSTLSLMEAPFLSKAWVKQSKWADRSPAPIPARPMPSDLARELEEN